MVFIKQCGRWLVWIIEFELLHSNIYIWHIFSLLCYSTPYTPTPFTPPLWIPYLTRANFLSLLSSQDGGTVYSWGEIIVWVWWSLVSKISVPRSVFSTITAIKQARKWMLVFSGSPQSNLSAGRSVSGEGRNRGKVRPGQLGRAGVKRRLAQLPRHRQSQPDNPAWGEGEMGEWVDRNFQLVALHCMSCDGFLILLIYVKIKSEFRPSLAPAPAPNTLSLALNTLIWAAIWWWGVNNV